MCFLEEDHVNVSLHACHTRALLAFWRLEARVHEHLCAYFYVYWLFQKGSNSNPIAPLLRTFFPVGTRTYVGNMREMNRVRSKSAIIKKLEEQFSS